MRKSALAAAVVAALCGAALAFVSTLQHLRIAKQGLEEMSFCAVSDTVNCDIVNASSYSEFLGVPIAWWGFVFYALVAGLSLYALLSKKERRASVMAAWVMALFSIAYSTFLAYIAIEVLGVVCIECIGMYAANLVLAVSLFASLKIPFGGAIRFFRDYVLAAVGRPSNLGFNPHVARHAALVAIVFLAGWISIAAAQGGDREGKDKASLGEKLKAHYLQSSYSIVPDPAWFVWGNPDAKVTVVEYSDFQCPFCRVAALNTRPYLQEFRKEIRYYFANYPLDNACNPELDRPMHMLACFAAKAAICAGKKGDFWSFHDEIFREQKGLTGEKILAMAARRGWDTNDFQACIDSPETDAHVKKDIEGAKRIYITGTPSIFLDDRKVRYWRDPKFLQAVVKEEIRRVKKGAPLPAAAKKKP